MNKPDKIISIEEIGTEETVDICVSDNNLFFANDILTHNSGYGEEMPDLDTTSESMGLAHTVDAQMCIWTSEADFELGIIHLGIVKNRFGNRGIHTQLKIDYPTLSISELDDVVFSYTLKDSENTKKNSEKTTNISQSTEEHSNISDILSSAEMFADDSDK